MHQSSLKGALFDFDDTLYERQIVLGNWTRWFIRTYLREQNEYVAYQFIMHIDAGGDSSRKAFFEKIKSAYRGLSLSVSELIEIFHQTYAYYITIDSDAQDTLLWLNRVGVPFGIVSNASYRQLEKIQAVGLDKLTSCIIISGIVGYEKPDPKIFQIAAENLGLSCSEIIFVGDHPAKDIIGAFEAGMTTAWLHRNRKWSESSVLPDYTIRSIGEIKRILR